MIRSLTLGLLCACSVVASAATVNIQARNGSLRPLYGINIGPLSVGETGNADLIQPYRDELGVTLIRTHDFYGPLDMATMYPDRRKDPALATSYNFSQAVSRENRSSDQVFASIVDHGFEPYFRLGDSYDNATPPSETERSNWINAAINVLKHYRQGQWSGFRSNFRYVEIWNEPDYEQFWPRPATPLQFFQLYDATAKALRAAFPELKIGGPAITQQGCTTETGKRWLNGFLDYVKQQNSPLDFFSWHIYSNSPSAVAACAAYFRQQLDNRGYRQTPMHLTEWNTDAEQPGQSQAEKLAVRTQGRGAAILTGTWIALQKRDDIEQTLFYRGPDPSMDAPTFYGLYYANGQPKKAAQAWQLWRAMSEYPHRLFGDGSGDLHLLAAEKDDGQRALLLANTGSSVQTLNLSFKDGKTLADYTISQRSVSDASTAIVQTTPSGSSLTIPAESVLLVELTPRSTEFAAQATMSGLRERLSLHVELTIAAADRGKNGSLFLAAQLGEQWFVHNGQRWQPWSGGSLPAYSTGPLPDRRSISVLTNADARPYSGIKLYAGYGLSAEEMIEQQRYRLVHTFE